MRARSPKFTIYQVGAKIRALGFVRRDWCSVLALAGQTSAAHQLDCLLAAKVMQHAPHLPHVVDARNFQHERREYAPRGSVAKTTPVLAKRPQQLPDAETRVVFFEHVGHTPRFSGER